MFTVAYHASLSVSLTIFLPDVVFLLPSGPEPSALWGVWCQQVWRRWLFHASDLNPPHHNLHLPHTHT